MNTRRLWMMWWSGVFSVATFVHLMRALSGVSVAIGRVSIPLSVSWVVFPITGFMAGWLMRKALEAKEPMPHRPPWMALGGLHPKSLGKPEEPQHAGHTYCGILTGYHMVGEDDEEE